MSTTTDLAYVLDWYHHGNWLNDREKIHVLFWENLKMYLGEKFGQCYKKFYRSTPFNIYGPSLAARISLRGSGSAYPGPLSTIELK